MSKQPSTKPIIPARRSADLLADLLAESESTLAKVERDLLEARTPSVCTLESLGDLYCERAVGHRRDNLQRGLLSYRLALRALDSSTADDEPGRETARISVKLSHAVLEWLRVCNSCFLPARPPSDRATTPHTQPGPFDIVRLAFFGSGRDRRARLFEDVFDVVRPAVLAAIARLDAGLAAYARHAAWVDDMRDARVYLTGWVSRGLLYEILYRDMESRRPAGGTAPREAGAADADTDVTDAGADADADAEADTEETDAGTDAGTDATDAGEASDHRKQAVWMETYLDECIRSLEIAFAVGDDSRPAIVLATGGEAAGPEGARESDGTGAHRDVIARCHHRLIGMEKARAAIALSRAYCALPQCSAVVLERARRTIRGIGSLLASLSESDRDLQAGGLFVQGDVHGVDELRAEGDAVLQMLKGSASVSSSRCTVS